MLKIQGHSDDIVCANVSVSRTCPDCGGEVPEGLYEGTVVEAEDEIGAYEQTLTFAVGDPESGAVVIMYGYNNMGCWYASVFMVSEDVQIPWPITIESEGYAVVVKVDCPIGTPVSVGKKSTP